MSPNHYSTYIMFTSVDSLRTCPRARPLHTYALDSDCVSSVNKLVVAIADVVNENNENVSLMNELERKQYAHGEKEDREISLSQGLRNDYYEYISLNFSEQDFILHFKMKRSTFQALVDFLRNHINPSSIPLDKKVMIFLLFVMNDYSFNDVGRFFGLCKSSISYIFYEVGTCLKEQRHQFISWPSLEDQHITRIKVNSRFKFPNCVGFIDVCRLTLDVKKNKDKPNVFLLQGVCDESLMFIDIHIGEMDMTKKNKVFKTSKLSQELKNFVEFDNHILGDTEYKLKKNLIVPYTSEEILTSEEMKFNEELWKARSYIGQAFELLKTRFQKLNSIDFIKPGSVDILIFSACVLHNFILLYEGCSEVKEEIITCGDGVSISTNIVKTAEEKRQFLCNYVNYIDSTD